MKLRLQLLARWLLWSWHDLGFPENYYYYYSNFWVCSVELQRVFMLLGRINIHRHLMELSEKLPLFSV